MGAGDHAAQRESDLVAVGGGHRSADGLGGRSAGVLAGRERQPQPLGRRPVQHQDRVGGVEHPAGPLGQQVVGGPHRADLGIAGDARPGRAVPPGQRAGQLVARLLGLGLEQATLTGQQAQVGLRQPTGEISDVLGDRLGPAEGGEVRAQQREAALDRAGQSLAVEQCEVLEEMQPAALMERLVGQPLAEDQVGARSRATHVYPEAQDTIDLGLADTSHEATKVAAGGPLSWRFGPARPSSVRPAYRRKAFLPVGARPCRGSRRSAPVAAP